LIESCPSRIFLPSPQATEPQLRCVYESFGLNARQIDIISRAVPKRDYYYQSPLGHRLFELALGPVALAFVGASSAEDQRSLDELAAQSHPDAFISSWLVRKGVDWAANLLNQYPSHAGDQP
jgi:type IV secretion system protein VirB4